MENERIPEFLWQLRGPLSENTRNGITLSGNYAMRIPEYVLAGLSDAGIDSKLIREFVEVVNALPEEVGVIQKDLENETSEVSDLITIYDCVINQMFGPSEPSPLFDAEDNYVASAVAIGVEAFEPELPIPPELPGTMSESERLAQLAEPGPEPGPEPEPEPEPLAAGGGERDDRADWQKELWRDTPWGKN
jgi:hypothetical protein